MYQRTMIKMHAKFTWLKECKQVFITINKKLCNAPVMAYFNPNRETKLILDRSTKTGFSSILTQLDPEMQQHQAVYYESRSTKLQEQRYSQIEIESAAIEFGVSNSHIYLCGILEFTIIRDQRPFLRIYSTFRRKPPPRILKCNLRNQGYNFTFQYEPRGAKNLTDYLSRKFGRHTRNMPGARDRKVHWGYCADLPAYFPFH